MYHVYRVKSDGTTLETLATYTYNSKGQVLTVTDASAAVTTYTYSATTGDMLTAKYPKNSASGSNPLYTYGRDAMGRVISVKDPLNSITTYTYDNLDRILTVTLPKPTGTSTLNFLTTYSYDNYDAGTGLVFTHQTDPNGKITKQGYDQFGQMLRSIDALNQPTVFTYTKGLLTGINDANNNVTSYTYNGLKRLVTTTFPDSTTEIYTYHANYRKHGISFDRASTIFLDPLALSLFDAAHSKVEERWITLGVDQTGTLLVVSHTFLGLSQRKARIRIISARKATKKEKQDYNIQRT